MSIRAHTDGRRLDQRVTFERNTPVQDASGDPVAHWATVITCHAAVDGAPARQSEPYVGQAIQSRGDYTVWIRSDIMQRFALTVLDRISWKGKVFDIKDIPDQQLRGRLIAVIATTGLNEG